MFQNLVDVLNQIDPAKLNAVLAALAEGCAARASASVRPPPTPTRCCWRSTRAATPSAPTGGRSRASATPTAPRRTTS